MRLSLARSSSSVSFALGGNPLADFRTMHTGKKMKIALWVSVGVIVVCLALPLIHTRTSPLPLLIGLLAFAVAVGIPILLGRRRVSFEKGSNHSFSSSGSFAGI
jgi:hypothetical protein